MKNSLIASSVLVCALCSTAQESPAPATERRVEARASSSVQTRDGKIVIETDVNGKRETRVIDLNDPATNASMQGKAVITTEINGKKETRIVDLKDVDRLPPPFLFNEKPLARTGPVTYLGVATMEVPRDVSAQLTLPRDTGLLIGAVAPDSPAAKAGLMESDVLSKFDDQILITQRQLAVLIGNHNEGDSVKLTYFRKGQQMEATATLGKHEAPAPMEAADPLARVTRHIFYGTADAETRRNAAVERLKKEGYLMHGGTSRTSTGDVRAEHDVGGQIRRVLEKLPPEVRSEVEKALRESGVLPKGALPSDAPSDPKQEEK